MVKDKNQDDESGSANNSGTNDAAASAAGDNSAPIDATTNAASNTSQGMERSLPSEQLNETEIKPEITDPQQKAAQEVFRMLGFQDIQATAAAQKDAAGGYMDPSRAALENIVKTDAGGISRNAELASRVAEQNTNTQLQPAFLAAMAAVDALKQEGKIVDLAHKEHAHVPGEQSAQLARVNVGSAQEQTGPAPAIFS